MENSVAIRNETLTLEAIRIDSHKVAAELSEILKQKDVAAAELATLKENSTLEQESIAKARNDLQVRSLEIDTREAQHEESKRQKRREIEELDAKVREGNKLLQRIQGFIFDANTEYDKKQGELHDINKEIEGRGKLIEGILSLKNEYAQEEKKRDDIRLENSLSVANAQASVRQANAQKLQAQKDRDEALQQKADAESTTQRTHRENAQIKADMGVLSDRITRRYRETHPELNRTE